MQTATRNDVSIVKMDSRKKPDVIPAAKRKNPSVSAKRNDPAGYLVTGIALGVVFGMVVGSLLTLIVGERSLLLAQHLWDKLSGSDSDSEHVHFEWLLQ